MLCYRAWALALVVCCLPAIAGAQSPEFEKMKAGIGEWDCVVKMMGSESKATASCKLGVGGTWLVSEFKGDFGGMAYAGHGMDTYDAAKKKYVGVWIDSMTSQPMVTEGTMEGGKLVAIGMGSGPDGKPAKHKMVTDFKSKDQQVFDMYTVGDDGKETLAMTIIYNRKK